MPSHLPHRDEHIQRLAGILAPALHQSKISNVFVYGKTGTGKTIVTKFVLDKLEKKATEIGAPVKIAYINCRLAGTNYRVLAEICRAIGVEVPFTGIAVGGQASLGLDWHLGDTFVISPFAGYQFASGNSFQSTVNNSNSSGASSGQTAQLEVVPTSNGNVITPVSNGKFILPVLNGGQLPFEAGSAIPSGSRPLEIDLSGPYAGLQVSAFF